VPLQSPAHAHEMVFDKAALMRQVDHDPELLRDIIHLFLESAPALLSDVRNAVDRADSPALFAAAHSLRGSARNFYAHEVEQAALTLELMAQQRFLMDAQKAYRVLDDALDKLCSLLRAMPHDTAVE
jgi:HPt (histidine-containing phosphotransfer) domain-containing protein